MVLAVRVSLGREGLWVTEVWTLLPAGAFYVPQPGRDPPHVVTPLADPVTNLMGLWVLGPETEPPGMREACFVWAGRAPPNLSVPTTRAQSHRRTFLLYPSPPLNLDAQAPGKK